jgi:hypothetical protein
MGADVFATSAEVNSSIATKTQQLFIDIENYRIDQKKQGRPEATWKPRVRMLKQMLTLTDLADHEAVKLFERMNFNANYREAEQTVNAYYETKTIY